MRTAITRAAIGLAAILIVAGIVFAGGTREGGRLSNLTSFSAVHMSVPGRVEYLQGAGYSVNISGPSSAAESVHVYVRNGVLFIEGKRWRLGRPVDRLVYTVTAPALNELITSSSGDIHADRVDAEEIRLVTSSSGDIEINALTAESARIALTSSGRIVLGGSVREMNLRVSSSGDFHGRTLRVENANVSVSSSGDAHVQVRGSLSGGVSSSGDLYYYGDPQDVRVQTSSSGRAHAES